MSLLLPAVPVPELGLCVVDRATGELIPVTDAPDGVLADVSERLADLAREAREVRSMIDDELQHRLNGDRARDVGAHRVERKARREWDTDATWRALADLVTAGLVTPQEADEAMPEVTIRKPSGTKLNALLTRLVGVDPVAAQALARARTETTWVKVTRTAVDAEAEAV